MSKEKDWRKNWRDEYMVPAWCPLCDRIMKGDKSSTSYYKWKCCSDCFIAFIEDREESWRQGKRPDKSRIEAYYEKIYKKL